MYFSAAGGGTTSVNRNDAAATPDHWRKLLEGTFPPAPAGQSRLLGFSVEDPDARYDFLLNLLHVPAEQFPGDLSDPPVLPRHLREAQLLEENLPRIVGELTRPAGTSASQALSSPKRLLRVRRQQIDTNGNGLFDDFELVHGFSAFAAEGQSGYAAPSADPDHDGLTNTEEQSLGTSPQNSDTDFDGSPDGEEAREGTDPKSNQSFPPRLVMVTNGLMYDFYGVCQEATFAGYGSLDAWGSWAGAGTTWLPLAAPLAYTGLSSLLETEITLPAAPPAGAERVTADCSDLIAYGRASTSLLNGIHPYTSANLQHLAIWLQIAPVPAAPITRTFLRITERATSAAPEPTVSAEAVTATFPTDAPSTHSNRIDLLPAISADGPEDDYWEQVSVRLLPVEIILDSNNIAYKPDIEALGVSNYVTNNELPATSQFNDTNPDPENFRLQARLPNATTNSIVMKLEVKRDGAVVSTTNHTLDKKDGDFVRGQFLRLVTDTDDDAVSGDQTILVKLGDKIKASYDLGGGKVEQEIQVGRPSSEDNNEADKPWKHDIREVKMRFVVFQNAAGQPCVNQASINKDIDDANERLAQAGLRIKATFDLGNGGYPIPQSLQDGYDGSPSVINLPTADERAVTEKKDGDANTVDVFYVEKMNTNGGRGTSFPAARNSTGDQRYSNWMVISATASGGGDPFNMVHELLHVLLNSPHRNGEPATAVFKGGTSLNKAVGGTKRIGPYPDASTSGVGQSDTTTIRQNAETLP
ncbi:MAG: hypothetical protein KA004_12410 [Verrucomicrobiales bacterium]|nr:hypothetical protein [Verrucomicrobiales bacterium]